MSRARRPLLARRLTESRPYVLASNLKWAIRDCWRDLEPSTRERTCVTLKPDGRAKGHVLLSYYVDPFLDRTGSILNAHPQYWMSAQMAQTFVDLGYQVDVISYRNQAFQPDVTYDVVIDPRHNLERLFPTLPSGCRKIFLIDTANTVFQNAAEAQRLLGVQQRRGATLQPRRFERPNRGIEHADCGILFGNEFTLSTFRYAGKPLYRVPVPTMATFPWPHGKDWKQVRRHFLFLSSYGMVHKGLDLVLEAFARLPDHHLTVCAPVHAEQDFCAAYRQELFETANIRTVGWVDIQSDVFQTVTQGSVGLVYPSCSEGGASAVLTCLQAGMVPIVTYESSVDVSDFGVLLRKAAIENIRHAVMSVASQPPDRSRSQARRGWEYARRHHTRDHFAQQFRRVILTLLGEVDEELELPALPMPSAEASPLQVLYSHGP